MGASLSALDPGLESAARALVDAASAARLLPQVTSTRRSHAEQTRLYRRFLAGQSPYPAAPPGTSAHEYGWAFDLIVSPYDALSDVGATWQSWGGVWGAARDPVHFELPGASAAAKQAVLTPGSDAERYFLDALDFAVGFLPVVGPIETAAAILKLFPQFSESEILTLLSSPVSSLAEYFGF